MSRTNAAASASVVEATCWRGVEALDRMVTGSPPGRPPSIRAAAISPRCFSAMYMTMTGHDSSGNMPASVDWAAVAKASPVIVMYMAVKHLGEIATALMAGGRAGDDPVTIISNASMPHQKVAATTLKDAGAFVEAEDPPTPAIVVVGHAADWRTLLDWYKGPLRENPIG